MTLHVLVTLSVLVAEGGPRLRAEPALELLPPAAVGREVAGVAGQGHGGGVGAEVGRAQAGQRDRRARARGRHAAVHHAVVWKEKKQTVSKASERQ